MLRAPVAGKAVRFAPNWRSLDQTIGSYKLTTPASDYSSSVVGFLGGGASNWEPPAARPLSHFPTRSTPVNAIVEKVRYRTRVALLPATFCTTTLRFCGRKATQESSIPSGPCQGTKSFGHSLTRKYVQLYEVIEADDL